MDLTLCTLFGSTIAFVISIVALFVLFIICDTTESGYSAATVFLAFVGMNYAWGDLPITSLFTFENVGIYLGIGFIFSCVRTYFKGRELKKMYAPDVELKNFKLRDNVMRWWLLWPISMITWTFGHILIDVWDFVYDKISGIYEFLLHGGPVYPPKK